TDLLPPGSRTAGLCAEPGVSLVAVAAGANTIISQFMVSLPQNRVNLWCGEYN
ncbi:hypothetical protein J6590_093602, partial [Homalodisca vitripennis]